MNSMVKQSRSVVGTLLIGFLLMTGCSQSEQTVNEGPVATTTRFNSSGVKTRLERSDRDGNTLEEISYYTDGSIDNRVTYTYSDNGHLAERYDSSMDNRYIYTYDEQGRLISEVNEDIAGSYETRISYVKEGRLRIDSTDRHQFIQMQHLDEMGNILQWMRLDANGDTLSHSKTTYDKDGNDLEYISWDYGKFFNRKKYTYNATGDVIEEQILDVQGNIEKRYVNSYDAENRLVKIEQVDNAGEVTFTIEYIFKGNERSCHTVIPGMKNKITKEVYTYYPIES